VSNHLVVVLNAHADAVEHYSDENGALNVTAFDEAFDVSPQPGQTPSCISNPHHLSPVALSSGCEIAT